MGWAVPDLKTADLVSTNGLWTLALFLVPCFLLRSVWRTWKDPLRSIPGPFLAKFTGAWITVLEMSGHRSTTLHDLHLKHGHVVRIAPNQLSFASPQALKDIYGASAKNTKAPIYDALGFKGVFTTRDRDEYRLMKKRVVPSFSPAAVAELESTVHRQVANLVKCFDKRVDAPLDVLPWFRMLALGVVGEGFASESFGGLETEKTPQLLHDIDSVFPALLVWWMFPVTAKVLQHAPFKRLRGFLRAGDEFNKYCGSAYRKYLNSFDPKARHDLIARMVNERSALLDKNQSLPRHVTDRGIIDELSNLVFAGTDTSGNSMTYLFWELAKHPEWQTRLREELKHAVGDQANPPYSAISELPVLEAVVQETFRLHPAAPDGLLRVVPEEGGVIDGVVVPPKVIVSCQALTSQREPSIFPAPDTFNPQRWIDAAEQAKPEHLELMREQMMLFGKGVRACLGRRLAIMEIKYAVMAVVRRYHVDIGSPTTNEDMEMLDHFVIIPKGQRCVLRLTRV